MAEYIITYDTVTGNRLVRTLLNTHVDNAAAIAYSKLALSGQIVWQDIASGQVTSGRLASGVVRGEGLAAGAIVSAHVGAGILAAVHMAANAITSGYLASGAITGDRNVVSGQLTKNSLNLSGRVTATDLEPGTSIDIAEEIMEPDFLTAAPVSAQAVYLSASGFVNVAGGEGGASGRLPAIGYVVSGLGSGVACRVDVYGIKRWPAVLSAATGVMVFVGSGANLTTTAPSASGEWQQRMGRAMGEYIWLFPSPEAVIVT